MKTSEHINELAEALAIAQGSFEVAKKSGRNTFFKSPNHPEGSPYSTLEDILSACKPALAKNNLAVMQFPRLEDSMMIMTTRLMHKSGQFIEDDLPIRPKDTSAQAMGSVITYARRYHVASMLGIASEIDDDGNFANNGSDNNDNRPKTTSKPKPKQEPQPQKDKVQIPQDNQDKKPLIFQKNSDESREAFQKYRNKIPDHFWHMVEENMDGYEITKANVAAALREPLLLWEDEKKKHLLWEEEQKRQHSEEDPF
jgi:hypothetical protein